MSNVRTNNLGFPRIGPHRELKKALESYWSGKTSASDLEQSAGDLRRSNWLLQQRSGIDLVPSNDFSLYDHVLDTAVMVGAVPDRYREADGSVSLGSYFAMARGGQFVRDGQQGATSLAALEMTKWFDTNYHYLVPELQPGQSFETTPGKALGELAESLAVGVPTKPVLVGPLSFLTLAKQGGDRLLAHLPALLGAYEQVLVALAGAGAAWVQMDEPALGLDLGPEVAAAYPQAYARLAAAAPGLKLLVATYFTDLRANLQAALQLPVAGLHLDIVAAPEQLGSALDAVPEDLVLSLGAVDGRNVWKSDLSSVLQRLQQAKGKLGAERLMVAPSCSLLHVPVDLDLDLEESLNPDVGRWLAFATQRLAEVDILARALNDGGDAVASELAANAADCLSRQHSPLVHDPAVRQRASHAGQALQQRQSPYGARKAAQDQRLSLPLLPTTTIGSFPQTSEVRALRARWRRGDIAQATYEEGLRAYIADVVDRQRQLGLDVLVHGEPERNDMVEYFGEHLTGFTVSQNGWAQSYGSRCVKPPIIYGDVSRPAPITVDWALYAQSLTDKPVKGMLTGPVTILRWSYVRNDQPPSETCKQIALALRDEVADLEAAGTAIIQIDEPALREGLPLHADDREAYLQWAVSAFKLASSVASDRAQVHTHMCYAQFDDIMDAITALDADVISIEAARSGMDLLGTFANAAYPNDVGPGIWDIHSPRVPSVEELRDLLARLTKVIPAEQLWVNPDCGLKTRSWAEIEPALRNLVQAAHQARNRVTADR